MDTFPVDRNRKLPDHINGSGNCAGKKIVDVYSDVGLWCGTCSSCKQEFVYMPSTNTWMLLTDFESSMQKTIKSIEV